MDGKTVENGMKRCPLVWIEWEDSGQPIPGWRYVADFKGLGANLCVTVGWLLERGKTLSVAQNMGCIASPETIQASGVITIPKSAVRRLVTLREPRR